MKSVVIAIPRFSLSGGNLVSLEVAKYLKSRGYTVYLHSGFTKRKVEHVKLRRNKRGLSNTLLNIISFLFLSIYGLFSKKYIATHHLTSMFNFIRPVRFALVQDDELKFYPRKIKIIGRVFWSIYLKSNTLIFTNKYLAFQVQSKSHDVRGFAYVDLTYNQSSVKNILKLDVEFKALLILRDGDYKGFDKTVELFEYLNEKGINTLLVNQSRNTIDSRYKYLIKEGLPRTDFLGILKQAEYFICLSEWEGLGLPNFEAFSLGVKVISSKIPSALILNEFAPETISFDTSFSGVADTIQQNKLTKNSLGCKFLKENNKVWLEYIYDLIDTDLYNAD